MNMDRPDGRHTKRKNSIELCLVFESLEVYVSTVDCLGPQVVQYGHKDIRISINENLCGINNTHALSGTEGCNENIRLSLLEPLRPMRGIILWHQPHARHVL